MLVIGDQELEKGGVNVRLRSGENLGLKGVEEVAQMILDDCLAPFKRGGMRYNFCQ